MDLTDYFSNSASNAATTVPRKFGNLGTNRQPTSYRQPIYMYICMLGESDQNKVFHIYPIDVSKCWKSRKCRSAQLHVKTDKSQLSRTNRTTLCITANVLSTKVGAQCDKLATAA